MNIAKLNASKATHILSVHAVPPKEELYYQERLQETDLNIVHKRIQCDDTEGYDMIGRHWKTCLDFLREAKETKDGRVIVHCVAGINRSGLIACAAQMVVEQQPLLEVVQHCLECRRAALWNLSFQRQLCELAQNEGLLEEEEDTTALLDELDMESQGLIESRSPTDDDDDDDDVDVDVTALLGDDDLEKSLLKPLAAVLIESQLYNTWMPRWSIPPVGVAYVQKLGQTGRTQQILRFDLDIPFRRDLIIVFNRVEDVDENGLFAIHLGTYPAGYKVEPGFAVPSPMFGVKRLEFEGCFVFLKCPLGHPLWNRRLAETERNQGRNKAAMMI